MNENKPNGNAGKRNPKGRRPKTGKGKNSDHQKLNRTEKKEVKKEVAKELKSVSNMMGGIVRPNAIRPKYGLYGIPEMKSGVN